MNCTRVEALLHELVEGALSDEQRSAVEKHCAVCSPCNGILSELRLVDELLADLPSLEPPTERMWAALGARLAARPAPEPVEVEPQGTWLSQVLGVFRGHWRVFAPSVTVLIVLFAIWPLWTIDQPIPFFLAARLERTFVESSEAYRLDVTSDAMADASSEARLNLLDKVFSEARLAVLSADDYTGLVHSASIVQGRPVVDE